MSEYDQMKECRSHEGQTVHVDTRYPGFHHHPRSQRLFCNYCGGNGYGGGPWMEKHGEHVMCDYPGCYAVITSVGLKHHQRVHLKDVILNADASS